MSAGSGVIVCVCCWISDYLEDTQQQNIIENLECFSVFAPTFRNFLPSKSSSVLMQTFSCREVTPPSSSLNPRVTKNSTISGVIMARRFALTLIETLQNPL